jgi:hypothetical protein
LQSKFHRRSNGAVMLLTEKCPVSTEQQAPVNFTQLFLTSNFEHCEESPIIHPGEPFEVKHVIN